MKKILYNLVIILSVIPLITREISLWTLIIDWGTCGLFILEYIYRWSKDKKYPITFMGVVDLLTILPTFTLLNPSFKLLRLGRFIKFIKLIRVIKDYRPLIVMMYVIKKEWEILMMVLGVSCLYIFITATIMFNFEDPIAFDNFFDALYWATCTLTIVGYGDIYPITWIGKLISMLSSVMGVAIVALPSGIITASYLDELKKNKEEA